MGSPYFPARTVLFRKEASGVTYRIPALLYLPGSTTFLAFCEERFSPDDAQANLLALRRGVFYRNYVEWEDMTALESAQLRGYRSMNPCPVYDEFTGTVFLFFIAVLGHTSESQQLITGKNVTRLCYVSSGDQGRSWSSVTDLTQCTIGDTIEDWATFALGPGHGIQLKSGRLLVPAYAYYIHCRECFGKVCLTTPHSFCFHSDTHGRTWRFGEFVPNLKTVECQMVSVDEESGTNVLYCNARTPLGYRVQALSFDDGAVFQEGQLVQKLVEPPHGCHGSTVGFPAPFDFQSQTLSATHKALTGWQEQASQTLLRSRSTMLDRNPVALPTSSHCGKKSQLHKGQSAKFLPPTWVIYSHPTFPSSRLDLGIYLSLFPRDPDSWTEPWVIYEGPSAYSDLAYLELPSLDSFDSPPGIAFACLFENGTQTPYEEISFSIFTFYDLIRNIPRGEGCFRGKPEMRRSRKWNHCSVA
nr:PREDICTED: sialidase-4 isoform X1 [Lepisosteus oculatus]XP_015216987.1 PREDICTED: sialidase-4 isoform X1 [Lepisosteus oculatus]